MLSSEAKASKSENHSLDTPYVNFNCNNYYYQQDKAHVPPLRAKCQQNDSFHNNPSR